MWALSHGCFSLSPLFLSTTHLSCKKNQWRKHPPMRIKKKEYSMPQKNKETKFGVDCCLLALNLRGLISECLETFLYFLIVTNFRLSAGNTNTLFIFEFPSKFKQYKIRQIIFNFRLFFLINRSSVGLKTQTAYFFKTQSNCAQ